MTGTARLEVAIDWARFDEAATLRSVPIDVIENSISPVHSSTLITIVGLKNPDYWRGPLANLQREIAGIVSPYENTNGVGVFVEVNGKTVEVERQARALLDSAPVSIEFHYRDGEFRVETGTRISVLSGQNAERRYFYQREIAPDNGHHFSEWLLTKKAKLVDRLSAVPGDDLHFIKTSATFLLSDVAPSNEIVADPGDFWGELGSISLEDQPDESSVLNAMADFKSFAKAMTGIKVYRDGFGIRLDDDWLGLSKQQTSGGSWYGLRPSNTIGFVNLTAQHNNALEETSSREDFSDTPAWRGFRALLGRLVQHVQDSQELIRRGWNEYCASLEAPKEVQQMESPRQIVDHIGRELQDRASSEQIEAKSAGLVASLEETRSRLLAAQAKAKASVWSDSQVTVEIDEAAARLETYAGELAELLGEIQRTKVAELEVRGALSHLSSKLDAAEMQLTAAWESVALGLSAETLGHEVANISERLRGRSTQILNYLRARDPVDKRSTAYAEEVRATAAELARQAGRLDPMLRHRREHRDVRLVSSFVSEAIQYHEARWERESIEVQVEVESDFKLRFNPGKFSQVVDNLVLNSEYWLRRWMSQGQITTGQVVFSIDSPVVTVRDNGPGIPPSFAGSIFDAFVSSKPPGEGRGLGLFIIRQLLDSEGATISLLPSVNGLGNFDTFVVDFSGSDRG